MFKRIDAALIDCTEYALDCAAELGISQVAIERNAGLAWIALSVFDNLLEHRYLLLSLLSPLYCLAAISNASWSPSGEQRANYRFSRWHLAFRSSLGLWLLVEIAAVTVDPTFERTLSVLRLAALCCGSYVLVANPSGGKRKPVQDALASLRELFGGRLVEVFG